METNRKEVVEWVRGIYQNLDDADKRDALRFFPDLKESEDERIRKGIIHLITCFAPGQDRDRYIAYLERQKEPEFNAGDILKCTSTGKLWIRRKDGDNIASDGHTACIGGGFTLASEDEADVFFHELEKNGYRWSCSKKELVKIEQKPSEKQDYSGLNKFERVILRGFLSAGVENVPVGIIKDTATECIAFIACVEQKPEEWSEDDENAYNNALDGLKYAYEDLAVHKSFDTAKDVKEAFDWLKNRLKSIRPQPKQEWSEEDETRRTNAIILLKTPILRKVYQQSEIDKAVNWLGELIPTQPHWKPSEEQMKALGHFVDFHSNQYKTTGTRWPDYEALQSLQTDLLKLK